MGKTIEKKITAQDYQKAKKITEKYKLQLRNEIKEEQQNCEHKSFYRYWYGEDTLINVCRTCFHEWNETYRPFLLSDYSSLTGGEFKRSEEDLNNLKKYHARLESINEL